LRTYIWISCTDSLPPQHDRLCHDQLSRITALTAGRQVHANTRPDTHARVEIGYRGWVGRWWLRMVVGRWMISVRVRLLVRVLATCVGACVRASGPQGGRCGQRQEQARPAIVHVHTLGYALILPFTFTSQDIHRSRCSQVKIVTGQDCEKRIQYVIPDTWPHLCH